MKDNPYGKLLGMMRSEGAINNPSPIVIAEVVSASPVAIKVGDIIIEKDNLLVSDYLLKNYKRSARVDLEGVNKVGSITTLDTFNIGDMVAVAPINGNQLFIILSKVVRV